MSEGDGLTIKWVLCLSFLIGMTLMIFVWLTGEYALKEAAVGMGYATIDENTHRFQWKSAKEICK